MKISAITIFLLTTFASNFYFFNIISKIGWDISSLNRLENLAMKSIFIFDTAFVPGIFCVCYVYLLKKVL